MEVCGRDLMFTLCVVLSEFLMGEEEWNELTPLLEYIMNHRSRDNLGGGEMSHSRHDGQGVRLVIDLTLWMNVKLKDVTLLEGGVERVLSCHV